MITRIRDLREDSDLTQTQISKILNISQVAYSYYEIGKREIPLDLLCKLADYYDTSVDYLLFRTNIKTAYKNRVDIFYPIFTILHFYLLFLLLLILYFRKF